MKWKDHNLFVQVIKETAVGNIYVKILLSNRWAYPVLVCNKIYVLLSIIILEISLNSVHGII